MLKEMYELVQQQSEALRQDDYEKVECIAQSIQEIVKEILLHDERYKTKCSEEEEALFCDIKKVLDVNKEIGARKLADLKQKLKKLRQNKMSSPYEKVLVLDGGSYLDKKK